MQYPRLKAAAAGATWAIDRVWLEAAIEQSRIELAFTPTSRLPQAKGNVAILPIYGMLTQRGSIWQEVFGGTSTQAFEAAFSRAMASKSIGAIVLDIDSPGGTTPGVQEAADRVYAARGQGKPIVAVANSLAASAAYWIGSAADQFIAAPGADTGSIGVFRMHEDISGAMEQEGVKVTFFAQPPGKVAGNPFQPLDKATMDHQMEQVSQTYDAFAGSVSRHRGITRKQVNDLNGQSYHSQQAKSLGLVDRIATLSKVLQELGVGQKAVQAEGATAELQDSWESCEIIEPRRRYKEVERRRLALDSRRK